MKKKKLSKKDLWKILEEFLDREPRYVRQATASSLPLGICKCHEVYKQAQLDLLYFIKNELLTGNTVRKPSGEYEL